MESRTFRIPIMLVFTMVVFLGIQYGWYHASVLSEGVEVVGTDTFMRLVRVEELHTSGDWFDSTIDGSNAPFGDELHWTRPLDVVLYVPALIGSLFTPFSQALYHIGIWLGPFLGAVSIFLVYWLPGRLMNAREKPLLLLVFLTQPILFEMFKFGRPDHHSLLVLLFLIVLGIGTRSLIDRNERNDTVLGILLGVCFWVSVEAVILIVMVFITRGISWVFKQQKTLKSAVWTALALTVTTGLCILIEKPFAQFGRVEYDKISVVYAVFFLLIAAVFGFVQSVYKMLPKSMSEKSKWQDVLFRGGLLGGIGLAGACVLLMLYPSVLKGPFADVNPAIKPLWLDHVVEVQPLLNVSKEGIGRVLMYMGLPALSSGYLIYQVFHAKEPENKVYLFYFIGMVLYFPLSLMQIRWVWYLQLVALMPTAMVLNELLTLMKMRISSKRLVLMRPLTILVYLFIFTFAGGVLMIQNKHEATDLQSQHTIENFSAWVNANKAFYGDEKIVLTFLDFGPELLYRTDYHIIAAPYHRNDEGILFSYKVMTSQNMNVVKEALNARQVDWILLEPGSVEEVFYAYEAGNGSFYDKLRSHNLPEWIEAIDLPDSLSELKLFVYIK